MGILKLKNSLIVAILLGVSSGYCTDNENGGDDLFSTKPSMLRRGLSIPTLVREDDGLISDTAKYAQLLTRYMALEQRGRLAKQRWDENILNGISTLQRTRSTPRDDVYTPSETSSPTVVEYPRLLKKYAELEAHARLASQRWRQNILEGIRAFNGQERAAIVKRHELRVDVEDTGVDDIHLFTPISFMGSPRPYVRATSSLSSSTSEAEDDAVYAPRHPSRDRESPCPSVSSSSSSSSSSSLSYHASIDRSDAGSYVSDSDDEQKNRGGFFSGIFGWIKNHLP